MRISTSTTTVLFTSLICVALSSVHAQQGTVGNGGLIGQFFGGFVGLLAPSWDDLLDSVADLGSDENGGGKENPDADSENGGGLAEVAAGNLQFITCTQADTCFNDSTQTPGAWTCRPQYVGHMSVCVPTLLGVTIGREGDTCGCCGDQCPEQCQCACTNARGTSGVMARFNLFFGLLQFDQCLEPTVADAATSFTTLDISCSNFCNQEPEGDGTEGGDA